MLELLHRPWPWYVTGPLLGLVASGLLVIGNKQLGVSGNFRHLCAAVFPRNVAFFKYDWTRSGLWNLAFAGGIVVGGLIGGALLASHEPVAISARAHADLASLGVHDFTGLVPRQLFHWGALLTLKGLLLIAGGGFLIGRLRPARPLGPAGLAGRRAVARGTGGADEPDHPGTRLRGRGGGEPLPAAAASFQVTR